MAVDIVSFASSFCPNSQATLSFNATIGTGNILVVGVAEDVRLMTGVTYNGVPMVSVGTQYGNGAYGAVHWFKLLAPAIGTHVVAVTSSSNNAMAAGAWVLSSADTLAGVHGFTGAAGAGTADQPLVTLASAVGELVLDLTCLGEATTELLTVGGGQTQWFNTSMQSGTSSGAGSSKAGAASVTMAWSGAVAGGNWAQAAIAVYPAGAVATRTATWNPNPSGDNVTQYILYAGLAANTYTDSQVVPVPTTGTTYYAGPGMTHFALSATNVAGGEGAKTADVYAPLGSGTPTGIPELSVS